MATVCKSFRFEAAHVLPGHKGKCANLHGHSYLLEVLIDGPIKPTHAFGDSDDGFVIDFGDVSDVVKPLIEDRLDHKFLNEALRDDIPRTTAELLACWIFGSVYQALIDHANKFTNLRVRLWETSTAYAEVSYDDWAATGHPYPGCAQNRS